MVKKIINFKKKDKNLDIFKKILINKINRATAEKKRVI
jgi:hypothetical protein